MCNGTSEVRANARPGMTESFNAVGAGWLRSRGQGERENFNIRRSRMARDQTSDEQWAHPNSTISESRRSTRGMTRFPQKRRDGMAPVAPQLS